MQAHVQDKITQVKHLLMIKRGAYNGFFSQVFLSFKMKSFFPLFCLFLSTIGEKTIELGLYRD